MRNKMKKLNEIVNNDTHPYDKSTDPRFQPHPTNKEHKLAHAFYSGAVDGWYREQGTPPEHHEAFTKTEQWLKSKGHTQSSAHELGCDHMEQSQDHLDNNFEKGMSDEEAYKDAVHQTSKSLKYPNHVKDTILKIGTNL